MDREVIEHLQSVESQLGGFPLKMPDENVYPAFQITPRGNLVPESVPTRLNAGIPNPMKNHTVTTGKLPTISTPNSSMDYTKNGNLTTRRYFGNDGRATMDIDYTNHGNPKMHPYVPHYHHWFWNGDTLNRTK